MGRLRGLWRRFWIGRWGERFSLKKDHCYSPEGSGPIFASPNVQEREAV